jgi:signal peptide peptidase SppA
MANMFSKLVPKRFNRSRVVIPLVKLHGGITASRGGLCLANVGKSLEKAFAKPDTKAVAISLNSPGGSPVQSALIHDRIRQLAAKNDTKVLIFIEDVAASGGYWLATAGDEIFANASSIVGSIGVVSAGFGFDKVIEKIGIDRRIYTQGKNKVILDAFQPEKKSDVDRLKSLHGEIHQEFIDQVKNRRGDKLDLGNPDLFTGAFWTGNVAKQMGLVDNLGNMYDVLQEKFGPEVEVKLFARQAGLLAKLGLPHAGTHTLSQGLGEELIETLETRALWQRYGL